MTDCPEEAPRPRPTKAPKVRLDERLVAYGMAESEKLAQSLVMRGVVLVNDKPAKSPAVLLGPKDHISFKSGYAPFPWVSRGGLKLDYALSAFAVEAAGVICADIGASTGGFTDVLLSRKAAKVYAVDVGANELAWKLRCDPRVVALDEVNARTMAPELLKEPPALVVCDGRFISVTLALNAAVERLAPGGALVTLIKPQFESPPGASENGIVRDERVRAESCDRVCAWAEARGLHLHAMCRSPVTGRKGNVEYFLYARKPGNSSHP